MDLKEFDFNCYLFIGLFPFIVGIIEILIIFVFIF